MKLLHGLHKRIVVFSVLIAIQAIWIFLLLVGVLTYSPFIGILGRVISAFTVLYLINKDDEAGYKMIWIILILILPLFGGIIYLIVGDKHPSKRLYRKFVKQLESSKQYIYPNQVIQEIENPYVRSQLQYLQQEDFPVYKNTKVTYYSLGDTNYIDLLASLKQAKYFIFMEYFIVEEGFMFDQIIAILKQKVKEGVEVRFMYDDMGCLTLLPHKYYKTLREEGIQCLAFNPFVPILSFVINNRDHRKITVIDGVIGYSGGINLADEYINRKERFGHWKDTGIKIEGEATWNLTLMFLTTWNASINRYEDVDKYHPRHYSMTHTVEQGFVVPYGDSPLDNNPVGQNVYLNIINQAKDYLYIFTPYLIINETLQTALQLASKRGVDVRICTPGIPDKKNVFRVTRSYYEDLIDHGIRIYEYTPGFIHAKNFVCDDSIATVGTINMDYRSLFLHFECGVYMYQSETIMEIKQDFIDTIASSREITKDIVVKGKFRGLYEAVLRLFAPLL